jgi:hypothetical protein
MSYFLCFTGVGDGYYLCVFDRHFFSFLPDCSKHFRFSHTLALNSTFVYTLLSKLTWHGRA